MNREALAAALQRTSYAPGDAALPLSDFALILAAARERLAQMPETCQECDGASYPCPFCHGKGVLYPPALVERIADVLAHAKDTYLEDAVAVLDALNETP